MAESKGSVTVKRGDLLQAKEQYIAHQCNCISIHAAGLAAQLFGRHPKADDYAKRMKPSARLQVVRCKGIDRLGTIKVHAVRNAPYDGVINMMAQYYPGPVERAYRGKDLASDRHVAFRQCLEAIAKIPAIRSVAFPHRLGCGLAGGDWTAYRAMLDDWAAENPDIVVTVYDHSPSKKRQRGGEKGTPAQKRPKHAHTSSPVV